MNASRCLARVEGPSFSSTFVPFVFFCKPAFETPVAHYGRRETINLGTLNPEVGGTRALKSFRTLIGGCE